MGEVTVPVTLTRTCPHHFHTRAPEVSWIQARASWAGVLGTSVKRTLKYDWICNEMEKKWSLSELFTVCMTQE